MFTTNDFSFWSIMYRDDLVGYFYYSFKVLIRSSISPTQLSTSEDNRNSNSDDSYPTINLDTYERALYKGDSSTGHADILQLSNGGMAVWIRQGTVDNEKCLNLNPICQTQMKNDVYQPIVIDYFDSLLRIKITADTISQILTNL